MSASSKKKTGRWAKLAAVLLFVGAGLGAWFYQTSRSVTLQQLLEPKSRLRAFYEIWRINDTSEIYAPLHRWRNFRDHYTAIDILECPQGGDESLYLILRKDEGGWALHKLRNRKPPLATPGDFLDFDQWNQWWEGRKPAKPVAAGPPLKADLNRLPDLLIDLVDSKAKPIERPFDGNNIANGVFFDVNRDGFIERLESSSYGGYEKPVEFNPEVLNVVRVKRKEELVFSVMINTRFGEDAGVEWDWECRDIDGDGLVEILLGPLAPAPAPPVIFHWDETRDTFVDRARPDDADDAPYWILTGDDRAVWRRISALFKAGKAGEIHERVNANR